MFLEDGEGYLIGGGAQELEEMWRGNKRWLRSLVYIDLLDTCRRFVSMSTILSFSY